MKSSMEELIHHFKLFTEGFRVPEGEAYAAMEHPRASSASHRQRRCQQALPTEDPRAGLCPSGCARRNGRGHMIADAVAIIGTMDIVFGEIDR